ncbi:MAG: fructose-specific PTS transporter subunit EIIC [Alphaproteobacteria bacterium]|jgi:PTS system mannose-specific IIC component|nr:fructose-specific PTS transporter subunit EIIC [Alphaproteobacteria bacterium]
MSVKKIVGITGCAQGIAHTFMAAEALEKAGKKLNIEVKIETHGGIGVENQLTTKEISEADLVIIAADIDVEKTRFIGKKLISVSTNEALKDATALIQKAMASAEVYLGKGEKIDGLEIGSASNHFIKYLMSGLTNMIPLAIASGILLAIANTFAFHADPNNPDLVIWGFSEDARGQFFSKLFDLGKVGFTLMIPVFAAGVARAIGDNPAVAPAFIAGYIINDSSFLGTETGAGFLGAIIVGFGVGYFVKLLKMIPWHSVIKPVVSVLIIPVVATFVSYVVIFYLIGKPISNMMSVLYVFINNITISYAAAPVVYGFILGAMMGTDLGGPINKTALMVALAIFVDTMNKFGIEGVNAIPYAATCGAIAIAPLGAAFATFIFRKSFTTEEKAMGSSAFIMGMVGITEGAIPFAASNPKLIIANIIASGVAGALVAGFGIHFFGGIGSPLGAFVGYVKGPAGVQFIWIFSILFAALLNALMYGYILKNRKVKK